MHQLCLSLKNQGAEYIPFQGDNRGAAQSWNVGMRRVQSGQLDFVIIFSPSCVFTNSTQDFVDAIEKNWGKDFYYVPGFPERHDAYHCFAVTKSGVDKFGLFDENFYPAYFEDTDYNRRMSLLKGTHQEFPIPRSCMGIGLGMKHGKVFAHYWANINHLAPYYVQKWGGGSCFEKWEHPYNNPNLTPKDWILDKSKWVYLSQIQDKDAKYWEVVRK